MTPAVTMRHSVSVDAYALIRRRILHAAKRRAEA